MVESNYNQKADFEIFLIMNEDKAQIFLSHCSDDKDIAEKIARELRRNNMEVFLDTDAVNPGEEWAKKIEGAMLDCHGALILVSEKAFQAPWVSKEAYFLAYRRRNLENGFPVLPLLLDYCSETRPEKILDQSPFGAARLKEWQVYHLKSNAIPETLEPVLKCLLSFFQDFSEVKYWAYITNCLVNELSKIHLSILKNLAFHIDCPPIWEKDEKRLPYRLAIKLFHAKIDLLENAILYLADSVYDKNAARVVLQRAGPFCCIDGEAANRLATEARRIAEPKKPRQTIHIKGKKWSTGFLYVRRACYVCNNQQDAMKLGTEKWQLIQMLDTSEYEDLSRQIFNELKARRILVDDEKNFGNFHAQLLKHIAKRGPIVIFLPRGFEKLDAEPLRIVMSKFPELTFIICAENLHTTSLKNYQNLMYLEPSLEPEQEAEIHVFYERMRDLLNLTNQTEDIFKI